ncbi:hypothetical protein BGW38_005745 [Lunasporangiospora selenospora]|uniref:Uncharacterized protein n=1 Tax=Lunasporangiospora selenospora TaxID=979761 RepID=A0A9P6G058_9FUNG|nr:hypothetical protein BGW38_005745 [Lunasporangiospora selenospora]
MTRPSARLSPPTSSTTTITSSSATAPVSASASTTAPVSSLAATAIAVTAALSDRPHPYPTPSASPALSPSSPSPVHHHHHHHHHHHRPTSTSPALSLKTATLTQHGKPVLLHDSTLSLPLGTALTFSPGHAFASSGPTGSSANTSRHGNINNGSGASSTSRFRLPLGQSILGHLLAAHRPRRDHDKLGHDASLSLETIRPKESQRRSGLPSGWMLGLSKSTAAASSASALQLQLQQQECAMGGGMAPQVPTPTPGNPNPTGSIHASTLHPSHVLENGDIHERRSRMLPSVWLESVLSGLARPDLATTVQPHYATLPRVHWNDEPTAASRPVFPGLGVDATRQHQRLQQQQQQQQQQQPTLTTASMPASASASTLAPAKDSRSLGRRGSACELALGGDVKDIFQQNRSKTLSEAAFAATIAPIRDTVRKRSLDVNQLASKQDNSSCSSNDGRGTNEGRKDLLSPSSPISSATAMAQDVSARLPNVDVTKGASSSISAPASASTSSTTTTTTRGRFIIESSSSNPPPFRTRTLSTTSINAGSAAQSPVVATPITAASSPSTLSNLMTLSASSTGSNTAAVRSYSAPPRSLNDASLPPSPMLPPSSPNLGPASGIYAHGNNNCNTPPISIPRGNSVSSNISNSSSGSSSGGSSSHGKSNHQRTQSGSSIHSVTSNSSRRSQVIIPPPTSTSSFQFTSFSSIVPSSVGNGSHPGVCRSSSSGNIRNLSIQVPDDKHGTAMNREAGSRDGESFYLDPSTGAGRVHPLDETHVKPLGEAGSSSNDTNDQHHQTMNRVYPHQDAESPHGETGQSMVSSTPNFSCSSVSSTSSVGSCAFGRAGGEPPHRSGPNSLLTGGENGLLAQKEGYFRQRSLSATTFESSRPGHIQTPVPLPQRSPSPLPVSLQPQACQHTSSGTALQKTQWMDRPIRRTHGSVSTPTSIAPCPERRCSTPVAGSSGRANSGQSVLENAQRSSSYDSATVGSNGSRVLSGSPHVHLHHLHHGETLTPTSATPTTPTSDVVMVKKSATGRMFTVERAIPASPTKCSRFIVVSATDEICTSTPTVSSPAPPTTPLTTVTNSDDFL